MQPNDSIFVLISYALLIIGIPVFFGVCWEKRKQFEIDWEFTPMQI